MFGLKTGGILLTRKFKTAKAAEAWGKKNARGRGQYEVVPVRAQEFVKCDDRACPINKAWAAKVRRHPDLASEHVPHCHPTF